jgi:hypothetical protein
MHKDLFTDAATVPEQRSPLLVDNLISPLYALVYDHRRVLDGVADLPRGPELVRVCQRHNMAGPSEDSKKTTPHSHHLFFNLWLQMITAFFGSPGRCDPGLINDIGGSSATSSLTKASACSLPLTTAPPTPFPFFFLNGCSIKSSSPPPPPDFFPAEAPPTPTIGFDAFFFPRPLIL